MVSSRILSVRESKHSMLVGSSAADTRKVGESQEISFRKNPERNQMKKIHSAQDILNAFINQTASNRGATISIALRGEPYGYYRVQDLGVGGVLIEKYNGAVMITNEEVARTLKAEVRPIDKYIWEHPLGASSGSPGSFGKAQWGFAPMLISEKFASAEDFVKAIIGAYEKAGVVW